jgi:5'-methylthioadenosine phosphorylase
MTGKSSPTVAVIAGSGVAEHFELSGEEVLTTKFGRAIASRSKDGSFYILQRHGPGHTVPPHRIDYRANIAGLKSVGVRSIIATSAVGSMNRRFRVGEVGLAEQFIDFTKGRQGTFYDDTVGHTDMTNPYSETLNRLVLRAAKSLGMRVHQGLVYVCAEGPRFETAAEIRMFRLLGGDVVGMTGVPEVTLADEMGISYASLLIATNWAAGIQEKVSHDEVLRVMKRTGESVKKLVEATVNLAVSREGGGS